MLHHHLEKLQGGWGLGRWGGSEKNNIIPIIIFRSTLSIIWMWMPAKMKLGYFKFGQGMEPLTWMIWFALEHLTICGCEDRWKGGSLDCREGGRSLKDQNRALHYLPNIVSFPHPSPLQQPQPQLQFKQETGHGRWKWFILLYLQDCNVRA